jgi:hypothetical protein
VSSYCPRSSLPAMVLDWLVGRLAHLLPPRPHGQGGTQPLALEVRLDAVAAVLLDGLSYRRAGRMVGISKTEVGDSLDLLLGPLGALGFCQPDGTFVTTLDDLRELLAEMASSGEAVCVDGLATRVQRPAGWGNQKVLYDAKRHTHTAQGLAVSTIWVTCCGWTAAGRAAATSRSSSSWQRWTRHWTTSRSPACLTEGSAGWPGRASTGMPRSGTAAPSTGSPTASEPTTGSRRACGRWWSSRSPISPTPGRCAAGGGCCTGSGTSSAPLAR